MKRTYLGLLAVGVVLFVPVSWRMAGWRQAAPAPLEAAEVAAGKTLFNHVWTVNDPLAGGDGIGPVFNAKSCVACHFQGGVGGGGGLKENVTTYRVLKGNGFINGVLHSGAIDDTFLETLDLIDPNMPKTSQPTLAQLDVNKNRFGGEAVFSQRNTPALFGAKLIDEIPDRVIIAEARKQQFAVGMAAAGSENIPVGRVLFSKDGKAGKFGWKGQTVSLLDFVQGACANELGLSNPNQPQPVSIAMPGHRPPEKEDLTLQQCQQIASFVASLPAPKQILPPDETEKSDVHRGVALFGTMGCAVCHVPTIGSVRGIYSDLLLHRMGGALEGQGSYHPRPDEGDPSSTPLPDEWRTPPLWGVADTAPYLHDGRAATLTDAITAHGGQGAEAARLFRSATQAERDQLLAFLRSLKAPAAN